MHTLSIPPCLLLSALLFCLSFSLAVSVCLPRPPIPHLLQVRSRDALVSVPASDADSFPAWANALGLLSPGEGGRASETRAEATCSTTEHKGVSVPGDGGGAGEAGGGGVQMGNGAEV